MEYTALVFDFGCLVLIWLVQLIIYPGFQYYQKKDLKHWHSKYTQRVTIIVLPLMVGQLLSSCYLVYTQASLLNISKLGLVITNWILTFIIFVPLHSQINRADNLRLISEELVRKNWFRTVIWTMIFVLSIWTLTKP